MQKNIKTISVVSLIFVLLLQVFSACNNKTNVTANNFDRKLMLQNYADKLIRPAFLDLKTQVAILQTATQSFTATPNTANLTALQTAWADAYSAFQYTNSYNFGVAGEQGLRKSLIEEIATFPVSVAKIDNAITQGNANFSDFNRDARGFLAVEYLIFNLNNDNSLIISNFATENNFQNRKNFLINAVSNLKTRIDEVNTAWNGTNGTSGVYATEFVANDGTDVGSSTSQLYNEFLRSFEALKNFKLGIPLGKRAGQTQTEPTKIEAYYSSKTLVMMQLHFKGIENIWYGKSKTNEQNLGFKAYLASVEGGNALITSTETQLNAIKNALNAIPTNNSVVFQIQNSPVLLENLHTEIQKNTRFFKSDMSSLLGIAITFSSGDGD